MLSSGSRMLFGLALVFVLLVSDVSAHGWMSNPAPRGQYTTPKKPAYMEYGPASSDPDDANFICRNDPVMPKANWLPLQAGGSQSITLEFNAKHVGACSVYLTYDGDKAYNQMKWFKIWSELDCRKQNSYNVPIPSYLPSGEHVIFRWEWYALHVYPTVEYYTQCVDAKMTARAGIAAQATGLPQPQVNIPGHLPHNNNGDWKTNQNNYWWPWDTQQEFATGPAVATLNGQPSIPTIPPVVVPTIPPVVVPTIPPVTVPTIPPVVVPTYPPTTKPVATSAPTTKPAATAAPVAPTQAPPPVAPTGRPAPSQSVKLNVLNSAGVWWFATTISGHRASEVTKVQIKDSGKISTYTDMSIGWADVWVFDPASKGPLTLPITVKASLASGSSLTFTVNSIASTVVDSGVVFP